ncbi:MAG: MarR family transcriptional regulator, partial [Chloroflexi bacterium]|nr:MarR family transcriptional regulator [Chloroflexota bacterium]
MSEPGAEAEDFGILLGLAYQHFVDALNRHLREQGFADLGSSFGYVLRALAAQPRTATQLASRLHLTPQGAARIVDDMVQRGYVERRLDPRDGRARQLVLAPRGQQALRAARAFHAAFERDLADTWGTERAAALRAALEAIAPPAEADG